ncbi:hypothetical protein D9M69_522190 [compost metagenome]
MVVETNTEAELALGWVEALFEIGTASCAFVDGLTHRSRHEGDHLIIENIVVVADEGIRGIDEVDRFIVVAGDTRQIRPAVAAVSCAVTYEFPLSELRGVDHHCWLG